VVVGYMCKCIFNDLYLYIILYIYIWLYTNLIYQQKHVYFHVFPSVPGLTSHVFLICRWLKPQPLRLCRESGRCLDRGRSMLSAPAEGARLRNATRCYAMLRDATRCYAMLRGDAAWGAPMLPSSLGFKSPKFGIWWLVGGLMMVNDG